jgi:hypothetical protein
MRGSLLLALVLVMGCHKPGSRPFGNPLASIKDRIVNVVASGAISVDTAKAVQAASQAPPARTRVEEPPPARQEPPPEPPREPPSPPAVHVTRVDAARPTVFALRGQTHGGKQFCESHTTQEACNSACTAMLRANALTKPDASTPKSCACTEVDKGC